MLGFPSVHDKVMAATLKATACSSATACLAPWNASAATTAACCVRGTKASQCRERHQLFPAIRNRKLKSLDCHQRRNFSRSLKRGNWRVKRGQKFDKYSIDDFSTERSPKDDKNILVIGSSGVLGQTLVSHFGNRLEWNVMGADIIEPEKAVGKKGLGQYICLPKDGSMADMTGELYRGVSLHLQGAETATNKLDAVVCASGGWKGDINLSDMKKLHLVEANRSELEDIDIEEEHAKESAEVCDRMMRLNYYPIVAGSQIGRRFIKRGGLFVIIGASAPLSPTPGMLGYGSAKSAAHHYLQSWGPLSLEERDTTSVGILPLMIDTPANRAMMGGNISDGSDDRYSKMVKPILIANEIGQWIKRPFLRPHSGSLVKVIAKSGKDGTGGAAFHLIR